MPDAQTNTPQPSEADWVAFWLRPEDVARLQLAKEEGFSHVAIQVRVDRHDDYYYRCAGRVEADAQCAVRVPPNSPQTSQSNTPQPSDHAACFERIRTAELLARHALNAAGESSHMLRHALSHKHECSVCDEYREVVT